MHRDIYGARAAGMQTLMFDSDQGTKEYADCVPDYRITEYRDLLTLLGFRPSPATDHADPRRGHCRRGASSGCLFPDLRPSSHSV